MLRAPILAVVSVALLDADPYLFTFFRNNGETGIFFSRSEDGYHFVPVNGDRAVLVPQHPGMLMRDPQIAYGPDRTWHLVWTTGWNRSRPDGPLTIGHAASRDLVHWGEQQLVGIPLEGARNAWAPEMVWDARAARWMLFWSSTIPGKFPDAEGTGDSGYNHRVYSMHTRDFKTFSPPELFFDPGFNCIDATLVQQGPRWVMVFKDERKDPLQKRLRLAFATSAAGPFRDVTEPFSADWVEGPSVAAVGKEWLVYFDHYSKPQYYGAYRTAEWKTFEDVSKQVSFPAGARHGTVVRISAAAAKALESMR